MNYQAYGHSRWISDRYSPNGSEVQITSLEISARDHTKYWAGLNWSE